MTGAPLSRKRLARLLCACFWLALAASARGEPTWIQSIVLEPGWNAIYLEVTPERPEVERVFAGLPVISVWQWQHNLGRVQFIQDPAEGLLNREGWRGFFPSVVGGTPFLTDLFTLRGNQAYLVRLGGSAAVELRVAGRPALRRTEWVPDSFSLVGFHVDPANPPTVAAYFAPSKAHTGQPVYKLAGGGIWQLMGPGDPLLPGRSYWVYTEGESRYQGPLEVLAPTREGLEFGSEAPSLDLGFVNHSSTPGSVRVRQLASAGGAEPPVLAHWELDGDGNTTWPLLPSPFQLAIDGGGRRNLPLAVRRARISRGSAAALLEVTDGAGSRYLVPISAETAAASAGGSPLSAGAAPLPRAAAGADYSGLWVGSATIDKVSEVRRNVKRICPCPASGICPPAVDGSIRACQEDDGGALFCTTGPEAECLLVERGTDTPIPARREFDLRILIHCDDSGVTKLLKEVTLMFQEGPDEQTPGRFVLVVNDERLAEFTGSALIDGVPVGTRVSTAAFDFDGTSLPLAGSVGPGRTLTGTITLPPGFPTNPFRHRFHPDHNQLDENYQPFVGESPSRLFEEFEVTRNLTLELAAPAPETDPGASASVLVGIYKETLQGLHRQDISVEGSLRLERVSPIGSLEE